MKPITSVPLAGYRVLIFLQDADPTPEGEGVCHEGMCPC